MKLISNTLFGKYCKSKEKEFPTRNVYLDWYEEVRNNFDNFLEQPLKLEMFVPCNDGGNILEEPIFNEPNNENEIGNYQILIDEYYEAKEKVLFEGFEKIHEDKIRITIACNHFQLDYFKNSKSFSNYLIIEDLSKLEIQLTENAVKQIGI